MSFRYFLSNSSTRRFLVRSKVLVGSKARTERFLFLFASCVATSCVVAFCIFTFCVFTGRDCSLSDVCLDACCFAQDSSDSFDSFLTGAYTETSRSRTGSNRPPEPKQVLEGLFYPEGFLTISKPSPEPDEILLEKTGASDASSEDQANAKSDAPLPKFLNPGLETTPYVRPVEQAREGRSKNARLYFFAFSIALAALGLFVYFDYRYREQLREELERNARLSSPLAVSADFVDFPPGALDAPVQIPQGDSYETEDYRFALSRDAAPFSTSYDSSGEDESLEANFDFTPQGTVDFDDSLEPKEDFVVSETDE